MKTHRKYTSKGTKGQASRPFFPAIQAKLTVGQPNDRFEQEADRMADRVMNNISGHQKSSTFFPASSVQSVGRGDLAPIQKESEPEEEQLQLKCSACEQEETVQKHEEEESVQPKRDHMGSGETLETVLRSSSDGGQKLPKTTRNAMEQGFGADFGNISIHTGSNAIQMNRQLGAQAFTHGNNIYFNQGKYNPHTTTGKRLLAHELTHTLQQGASSASNIVQKKDLQSGRYIENQTLEDILDDKMLVSTTKNRYGAHVRIIQQSLLDAGFDLPKYGVDGDYGSETKAAVIEFQKARKLPKEQQDGIVGPITMEELDKHFRNHQVEHDEFAGIDQPTLDSQTRAITAEEKADVKEAMNTEVKKDPKTGTLPVFDPSDRAAYKKDLKAKTEKYVIAQYNALGKGKNKLRKDKKNLHDENDIEDLAKVSKRETDKVYGNIVKGKEFKFGTNIFDGWEFKKDKLKGKKPAEKKAIKKEWADWRVQKIVESDRVADINKNYGAVQSREPEKSVVKEVIDELSKKYRKELVLTHLGWPGFADEGKVYLQLYKSTSNDKNRDFMWDNFATIIHEYIHTLEHADAVAYRRTLDDKEGGKVLREGMPEYFSKIVWNNLNLSDMKLRKEVEGPFYDSTKKDIPTNHYYAEGKNAEQIAGIVGTSNVMAYFFQGKIHLIQ